jgi:GR25 family glycosyltransferase involved in LPS biosynthesis
MTDDKSTDMKSGGMKSGDSGSGDTESGDTAYNLENINDKINNKLDFADSYINELIDKIELQDLLIIGLIIIIVSLISYFVYHRFFRSKIDETLFDNMAMYYINLDRSPDRKISMEQMCARQGINPERLSAVDGKLLDLDDPKYEKALKKIKWWFLIENKKNAGHFGCYLSHMKIFEKFLKTDKEYCFILEDDAEILVTDIKREIMKNMKNLPRGWDILLLGYEVNGGPNGYKEVREGNKDTVLKNGLLNLNYFTGLQGYIINRKCAKKLIKNLQQLDWIIDWNMCYLARRGILNIYGVYPPIVCQPAVHMIQINDIDYRYNCQVRFDTLTNK